MTKYRVIKAYGPWSVGHIFTAMQGNEARTLMARGLVEELAEEKRGQNTLRAPVDRMIRGGVKRQVSR